MKRLVLFFVGVVLAGAVFAACGSGTETTQESADPTPTTDTTDTTDGDDGEPDVEPTAAPEPEPTEAPEAEPVDETPDPPEAEPVVYNDDFGTSIQPILINSCGSCHNPGGPGTVHWNMATAGDVQETALLISAVVNSGYMPPWPASDLSVPFHDDRSLSQDEIDAINAWADAGGELDVSADTSLINPNGVLALSRTDQTLAPPDPYQGSPANIDDYRCMIYDPELTETAHIQGYKFDPEQTLVVHHAIGSLLRADAMEEALSRDAEEPGAGWECYGGTGLAAPDQLFLGWAPGQGPVEFEDGTGLRMEPGDFIVLQIHYHFEVESPPDGSTLEVKWSDVPEDQIREVWVEDYAAPAEIPCTTEETGPLCDRDAAMAQAIERFGQQGVLADQLNALCGVTPADFAQFTDGIVSSSCDIPKGQQGEIVSILGHMHEIGSAFRMTLNPGQPDEKILLDIPDWDFDWQYNYYPIESIVLEPGDVIRVECTWDRARRDPTLPPSYILWADGTNDEMCFAAITTIAPDEFGASEAEPARTFSIGDLPADVADCVNAAGPGDDAAAVANAWLDCDDAENIGAFISQAALGLIGLPVSEDLAVCMASTFADQPAIADYLTYAAPEADRTQSEPFANRVVDCVELGTELSAILPVADSSIACLDDNGDPLLVDIIVSFERELSDDADAALQEANDELLISCLTDEELALVGLADG